MPLAIRPHRSQRIAAIPLYARRTRRWSGSRKTGTGSRRSGNHSHRATSAECAAPCELDVAQQPYSSAGVRAVLHNRPGQLCARCPELRRLQFPTITTATMAPLSALETMFSARSPTQHPFSGDLSRWRGKCRQCGRGHDHQGCADPISKRAGSVCSVSSGFRGHQSLCRNGRRGRGAQRANRPPRTATFRAIQYRAVRPEDYEAAAETLPWVLRAGTEFRWTGSWLTVFTTADPEGTDQTTVNEQVQLINLLNRYRLAGYESYVSASGLRLD